LALVLLVPQLVSALDVHVLLHHDPTQLPSAQACHGEPDGVLQGSPMSPLVFAQTLPVEPAGWQVVPETSAQSALVVHVVVPLPASSDPELSGEAVVPGPSSPPSDPEVALASRPTE
jgi:hypothetical protein